MNLKSFRNFLLLCALVLVASSCNKGTSNTTGWKYNNAKYGGFQVVDNYEQDTPPGMVLIGGGTFTMGRVNEDVYTEWNHYPRRVTVNTFYMDQYEISNRDWREYVYWMDLMYGGKVSKKCRPDSTVWRDEMAYNEPYLNYYFTHVAYDMYPVVGVTWEQATDYCVWRTDRVNERILMENGVIDFPDFAAIYRDSSKTDNDTIAKSKVFNMGKYEKVNDYTPDNEKSPITNAFGDVRKTTMNDGLMLPNFRLPTEAEWEFAAYGVESQEGMENYDNRRIYPWDGSQTRNPQRKSRGKIMANYVRGRGDMMGVAGDLNDKATITAPVNSFWPNEYGLYNMAGNVNEWTMDVYRQTTTDELQEYNPFRGNVYLAPVKDTASSYELDNLGRLRYDFEYKKMTQDENEVASVSSESSEDSGEENYGDGSEESAAEQPVEEAVPEMIAANGLTHADSVLTRLAYDKRNYNDGDVRSGYDGQGGKWKDVSIDPDMATKRLYDADDPADPEGMLSTKITNRTRVYKGGGWKDRAYWLSPAQRRYLEQDKCTSDIGFRCAMHRVGADRGNNAKK
ncbi:MAG: SUMF1/EgtB/PvdO family nonheme iron enzyme [Paludibacteraceae bacterium]|nr:SUMF1/EgtB/PvdO family nonheme iron enzyme [Paludibacteraceae bacterium]